jgi:hypothetical protein
MRTDDEQNLFQQITGSFDEPAFLRRAKNTEAAWEVLLARAERKRTEWLKMPTLHLGRLFKLVSNTRPLARFVSEDSLVSLQQQHDQLNPQLRRKILPATNDADIQTELTKLVQTFERFNSRWVKYVEGTDFTGVNELRAGYNKYYTLEKECALMSSRTATTGFQELPMAGPGELMIAFPLLDVPRLAGAGLG